MIASYSETSGWVAAFVAAVSFGSYGVPMKGEASTKVDVDPLVFQTYKTFMVFVTSCLLVLFGVRPAFTVRGQILGIISSLFWVPGGTAGIYAVRRAGLAISVGIWSSVIVFVSFVWGVAIFHESVRTISGAAGAAILLVLGIWGITYYSSPSHQRLHSQVEKVHPSENHETNIMHLQKVATVQDEEIPLKNDERQNGESYGTLDVEHYPHSGAPPTSERVLTFLGVHVTQYHLGLAMAAVNGLLAASIMVPMHFAGPETRGLAYAVSFGIGAVIVTALLWLLRICYHAYNLGSLSAAFAVMPSFHVREMWRPGCISGLLYSVGNISGIVAITVLGDFMGYSLGQSSLIVSGLWGIFYYREVQYSGDIVGWFISAFVMLGGILWLGHEHVQ